MRSKPHFCEFYHPLSTKKGLQRKIVTIPSSLESPTKRKPFSVPSLMRLVFLWLFAEVDGEIEVGDLMIAGEDVTRSLTVDT